MKPGLAAAALAVLSLAACATPPRPAPLPSPFPPAPAPPTPAPAPERIIPLAELPGWSAEDHAGAFAAFRETCQAARDPELARICREAKANGLLDPASARSFFEAEFEAERLEARGFSPPITHRSMKRGARPTRSFGPRCAPSPRT